MINGFAASVLLAGWWLAFGPAAHTSGGVSFASLVLQQTVPLVEQLLRVLANPNVAYLLFVLGLLAIVGEIVTAGAVLPGLTGAICLILALVGFGQLPTNWAGAALILIAVSMFLLDIKMPGHSLSMGGILAFALGSLLLFTPFWMVAPASDVAYLSPWVILATTVGVGSFFVLGVAAGLRAQKEPQVMGSGTLIGKLGTVRESLDPHGIVHVEGEEWSAVSADGLRVPAGTKVLVLGVDGLVLRVVAAELPTMPVGRDESA